MDVIVSGGLSFYLDADTERQQIFVEVLLYSEQITINMYINGTLLKTGILI